MKLSRRGFRNSITIFFILFIAILPVLSPVHADNPCDPNPCSEPTPECYPNRSGGYTCHEGAGSSDSQSPQICDLGNVIINGFNTVVSFFPLVGLGVLFLGAFFWATSAEDPQKLQRAQQTLTYGVIGLVGGLSAIAIIGTLQMIIMGNERFHWIEAGDDGGFLRVDLCLDEYMDYEEGDGADDGGDDSDSDGDAGDDDGGDGDGGDGAGGDDGGDGGDPGEIVDFGPCESGQTECGDDCCNSNYECVELEGIEICEPINNPSGESPYECEEDCTEFYGENGYCLPSGECHHDPCYDVRCPEDVPGMYNESETECYVLGTGYPACREPQ